MREKDLKALVHGFLMVLGIAEFFNCKSRPRRFVLGTAVGWHAHATFYHLCLEKEEQNDKAKAAHQDRRGRAGSGSAERKQG
jgi:hypothetical protein